MARLFGTDGVRGIANESLTCELAFKLGQATAYLLGENDAKVKILIGKDTRLSGDMLENALVAGITSAGADAVILGVIPTPAVAHLIRYFEADAGIMISASHNPAEYNGIKIFDRQGYKLADQVEDEIEEIISGEKEITPADPGKIGKRIVCEEGEAIYVDYLISTVETSLAGLRVAVDAANGAAYRVAEQVLKGLGAEVISFFTAPDGVNINNACGSTHPEALQEKVKELGADIGLAFDGDADRLITVDHLGRIVDGDKALAICAVHLKQNGALAKDTLVATVMSNLGLELYLQEQGISVVKTDVGDRYVLEEMVKEGYAFGGEQSGHIIFLAYNTTGDGVLTGIQLLRILAEEQKTLAALADEITILPQVLINARVAEQKKHTYMEVSEIKAEIEMLEQAMDGRGRVLIRTSGTEPLVRVMIEGEDYGYIEEEAKKLAALIEEKLA